MLWEVEGKVSSISSPFLFIMQICKTYVIQVKVVYGFAKHNRFALQWVVKGAVDVDIGANPSAEGGGEDEGVDDQAVKVVDIVDTFRLQVWTTKLLKLSSLG